MNLILINLQSNQRFELDGGNPLIIGRGNVEGCFDKRVSRNHGRVTCTVDGKVRLQALHCNPCFFTRNGVPPIRQIKKNEEQTLNEGDYLGLLPNAFWFKVTSNNAEESKKELQEPKNVKTEIVCNENDLNNSPAGSSNSSSSEVKEKRIEGDDSSTSHHSATPDKNSLNSVPIPVSTSNSEPNSAGSSKVYGTPEFEKTRRLPLWMYEIDEPGETTKSSNKHSLPKEDEVQKKKQKLLSEFEIKKESNKDLEDEVEVKVDPLNVPSSSRVVESCVEPVGESQTDAQNQRQSSKLATKKEGYESEVKTDSGSGSRPICKFEGNCYRKNPQHKLEFCHPGDADYVPYEERPVCPFGEVCYRRNPTHRIAFRHPPPGSNAHNLSSPSSSRSSVASSPLPVKRRRKKVVKDISYFDDEELEDPFGSASSSDGFVPSDLNSEDEEDSEEDYSSDSDIIKRRKTSNT